MKRPHDEGADQPAEDHACKLRRLSVTVPAFQPEAAAAKGAAGGAAEGDHVHAERGGCGDRAAEVESAHEQQEVRDEANRGD